MNDDKLGATTKIALAQLEISADIISNHDKAIMFMERAAEEGARCICFPELQFSPFFPQYLDTDVSEYCWPIDHSIVRSICEKAKELSIVAMPNFYLMESGNKFDCTLTIDTDGTILDISKMVHIAQVPYFYEQSYYTQSDTGFHVSNTALGQVAVVVCYDRHFPESIRTCALRGAQLIVIPTANTKAESLEMFEWEVRLAAVHNHVFIAMCNRTGIEGEMDFGGESIVVDPMGNVLSKANDEEQILFAELDFNLVNKTRTAQSYLKLRRPEMYEQ